MATGKFIQSFGQTSSILLRMIRKKRVTLVNLKINDPRYLITAKLLSSCNRWLPAVIFKVSKAHTPAFQRPGCGVIVYKYYFHSRIQVFRYIQILMELFGICILYMGAKLWYVPLLAGTYTHKRSHRARRRRCAFCG